MGKFQVIRFTNLSLFLYPPCSLHGKLRMMLHIVLQLLPFLLLKFTFKLAV